MVSTAVRKTRVEKGISHSKENELREAFANRWGQETVLNIKPGLVMIGIFDAEGLKDIAMLADRLMERGFTVHGSFADAVQRD